MTSFSGSLLVLLDGRDAFSGTGFSREEVGVNTMNLAV
jgi:hypothetical protein